MIGQKEAKNMIWKSVPDTKEQEWMSIVQEILHLAAPCPVCSEVGLYRYYHVHKPFEEPSEKPGSIGRGGLWVCGSGAGHVDVICTIQ
jgi:hypothetical protein